MSGAFADHLQIWGFERDFILFTDGSLGFGLEVIPVDVSCYDDGRVNDLAARIGQFLNGLPAGVDIQFVQEIGRGNEAVLGDHEDATAAAASPMARTLCRARITRLREMDAAGSVPRHRLKVFVRRPFSQPLLGRPRIFSRARRYPKLAEAQLTREIAAGTHLRETVMQGLQAMGLLPMVLPTDVVARLVYRQWNPARAADLVSYDPEDVRSSLLYTDALIDERGFSLADLHHRVLSLKLLPEQTYASMAACLRDLPFDSRLFLTIHVPDQQKELASLQTQRRLAYSMARGKRTGVADIESEAKFQDLETLLGELIAQGEKVFHASMNIVLRAKSREELDIQSAQALAKIRELGGAEAMEESLAAFDLYSEIALPNARARERIKRIKTTTLTDFLPIYGPWQGNARPSLLLRSRMGSLVGFDPFSEKLTNYNHVISGGSGSGKSFLTNILLLQMLKENPRIFIVDIGGSYRKLCEHLGGQYIPLGVGAGLSVNPFDLPAGEDQPPPQKIKFLVGLVELMTKEEGDARLPRLERAEIEEAIVRVYEPGRERRISTLRAILLAHENVEIRRYGRILSSWCGDTPFGRFVDKPTTIEFQRPVVAFDLKGMETHPDLQAVCLYIITDFVWREVQRDREHKKFLVFDECWKLLENDAGAGFIAEVFRTFRKYYAGAIAISQNMDDFAKSKVAGAILSNSSVKWCLTQKGADQARLKEVLQLNDQEMRLVASLHQERGVYSEAFLMAETERAVVAIESTPLEYWIATTDPRDLAALDARLKNAPPAGALSILELLALEYPRGVAAGRTAS